MNPLPLPLSAPGWALTAPELLIMVSSSSGKLEMTPDVDPEVTVAPLAVQLADGSVQLPVILLAVGLVCGVQGRGQTTRRRRPPGFSAGGR